MMTFPNETIMQYFNFNSDESDSYMDYLKQFLEDN